VTQHQLKSPECCGKMTRLSSLFVGKSCFTILMTSTLSQRSNSNSDDAIRQKSKYTHESTGRQSTRKRIHCYHKTRTVKNHARLFISKATVTN